MLPSASGMSSTTEEIIGAYAESARPIVLFVVEAAIFLGVMLPIFVSLLYFSTAHSRRSLMWNAVMLDIILCISLGIWTIQVMISSISNPFVQVQDRVGSRSYVYFSRIAICVLDFPLYVRSFVVFPRRITPWPKQMAIIGVALALMIARVVVTILCVHHMALCDYTNLWEASVVIGNGPLCMAHTVLKLVDNLYISCLFSWRLRVGFHGEDHGRVTATGGQSFASRVRVLFWISITTLILPLITTTLALVMLIYSPYVLAVAVGWANIYISIISVACATVWSTSRPLVEKLHRVKVFRPDDRDLRDGVHRPSIGNVTPGPTHYYGMYKKPYEDAQAVPPPTAAPGHVPHVYTPNGYHATLLERIHTLEGEIRKQDQENIELCLKYPLPFAGEANDIPSGSFNYYPEPAYTAIEK